MPLYPCSTHLQAYLNQYREFPASPVKSAADHLHHTFHVQHSGVYDFHSKYTKGETEYLVPAPLDKETTRHVQELAVATYKVLGCSGVARVDVMLDEAGKGYVLEANTVPGMTATSLVPKAAAAVGISFPDLCEKILLSASLNDK